MTYLLDTNIIINLVRNSNKQLVGKIRDIIANKDIFISLVSFAEIKSFSYQNNWGESKIIKLDNFFNSINILEINQDLIDIYVEIDSFSQGKHKTILSNFSKNMGKNDLWIASTAKYSNLTLITTDNDFNHLDPYFIKILNLN